MWYAVLGRSWLSAPAARPIGLPVHRSLWGPVPPALPVVLLQQCRDARVLVLQRAAVDLRRAPGRQAAGAPGRGPGCCAVGYRSPSQHSTCTQVACACACAIHTCVGCAVSTTSTICSLTTLRSGPHTRGGHTAYGSAASQLRRRPHRAAAHWEYLGRRRGFRTPQPATPAVPAAHDTGPGSGPPPPSFRLHRPRPANLPAPRADGCAALTLRRVPKALTASPTATAPRGSSGAPELARPSLNPVSPYHQQQSPKLPPPQVALVQLLRVHPLGD
jgi:hypothetical protein